MNKNEKTQFMPKPYSSYSSQKLEQPGPEHQKEQKPKWRAPKYKPKIRTKQESTNFLKERFEQLKVEGKHNSPEANSICKILNRIGHSPNKK